RHHRPRACRPGAAPAAEAEDALYLRLYQGRDRAPGQARSRRELPLEAVPAPGPGAQDPRRPGRGVAGRHAPLATRLIPAPRARRLPASAHESFRWPKAMARILVIEDQDLVRATLKSVLEGAGHSIAVAADGIDGLQQFQQAEFTLVICDVFMPRK